MRLRGNGLWQRSEDVRRGHRTCRLYAESPLTCVSGVTGSNGAGALLADRFKLKVHRETRELPVYALVMARPDRTLGPKLAPASLDCDAFRAAAARGENPTPPPPNGDYFICGIKQAPGRFLASGQPIADIARMLSVYVGGRPLIDRTGLTGMYDLELT